MKEFILYGVIWYLIFGMVFVINMVIAEYEFLFKRKKTFKQIIKIPYTVVKILIVWLPFAVGELFDK